MKLLRIEFAVFSALILLPMIAFCQAASPTPAPAVATPFLSASMIALIVAIVASLNVALSAIQQIFSNFAKQEPSWLTSFSKIVLNVAKYLGSNPSV